MGKYVVNDYISGREIRELRKNLSMTQKDFADFLCCSKRTVENWERNGDKITGPIVTVFEMLRRNPDIVSKLEVPPRETPLRIWYMYENTVCSIIDVDELKRKVSVVNYIDNPLYRAFGVNSEPDIKDYEEFLESRCFPRERDKMKLELKRLDLPFYDPIMIIEKTEGRMAEDNFWIRIER